MGAFPAVPPTPYKNPVLDELDRLSPQAKDALARAHQSIASIQAPPEIAPAPMQPAAVPGGAPRLASPPAYTPKPLGGSSQSPVGAPPPMTPDQQGHLDERNRLISSGSGISQVHNPFLKTLGTIGDVIGSTFAPRAAAYIPGTTLHHEMLLGNANADVKGDETQQAAKDTSRLHNAQAAEQESLPQLHQTQADLAATKQGLAEEKQRAAEDHQHATEEHQRQQVNQALAAHGQKLDEKGQIVPMSYDELPEPMKAAHDLKTSQAELADAHKALTQAQKDNVPVAQELARQRIRNAERNSEIALQRLGLSQEQFAMRAGGAPESAALPGQLVENGHTVGSAFQHNVAPTGTQRDAAGRAQTMEDLDVRIRKALQNPELRNATGPIAGRLSEIQGRMGALPSDLAELQNDLKSYGAFQAGMHPVRGVGALEYFDKVMGGLGQTPEQIIGKLNSNKATAESVKHIGTPHTSGVADQQTPPSNNPNEPTIDEINAEVERRKAGKK